MDEPIVLNGEKFISSKDAAILTEYAPDYIGQMARSGKVKSKMIGRTWYVSETSLLEHKNLIDSKRKTYNTHIPDENLIPASYPLDEHTTNNSPAGEPPKKEIPVSYSISHNSNNKSQEHNVEHNKDIEIKLDKEEVDDDSNKYQLVANNAPAIDKNKSTVNNSSSDTVVSQPTTNKSDHHSHHPKHHNPPKHPEHPSKQSAGNDISKGIMVLLFMFMGAGGGYSIHSYGVESLRTNFLANVSSVNNIINTEVDNGRSSMSLAAMAMNFIRTGGNRLENTALTLYGVSQRIEDRNPQDYISSK